MDRDFARIYENHLGDVYAFFAYRLGSRADAEDLTQCTFERALAAWAGFDDRRATPRRWLLAIARNQLIDHYRRRPRVRMADLDECAPELGRLAAAPELSLGIDPRLAAGLARLGERDREVVSLRFGGDMTGSEIASMLGLSLANVQQILSRSLRKLRAELERPDDELRAAPGDRSAPLPTPRSRAARRRALAAPQSRAVAARGLRPAAS